MTINHRNNKRAAKMGNFVKKSPTFTGKLAVPESRNRYLRQTINWFCLSCIEKKVSPLFLRVSFKKFRKSLTFS